MEVEGLAEGKHNTKFWVNLIKVIDIFLILLLVSQILFIFCTDFTGYCKREEESLKSDLLKLISKLEITFDPNSIEGSTNSIIQDSQNIDEYMTSLKPENKKAREHYKRLVKTITTEILLRLSDKPELLDKTFKKELPFNKVSIKDFSNSKNFPISLESFSIKGIFIPDLVVLISEEQEIQKGIFTFSKDYKLLIGVKSQDEFRNRNMFLLSSPDFGFDNFFLKEDNTLEVAHILLILKIRQKRIIFNSKVKYIFEIFDPITRQSLSTLKVEGLEYFLRN